MFQTRPFCRCIILLGICWFVKSHIHGVPPVLDYLWFDQISAAFRCFNQQAVSRPAPPTSQALQGTGAAPLFFDYHCRFLMIIATYSMHYKHTCIPPFDNQKRWKSWHLLKTTVFFWYPSIWNRKSSSLKFFEHQNKFIQVEAASRGVHVEDWIITVQSESPWSHVWPVVYLTYGYTIIPYNTWWLMYIHTHYIHIQFIFIHIQLHWMLWWEDELLHPLPPVGCWILFEWTFVLSPTFVRGQCEFNDAICQCSVEPYQLKKRKKCQLQKLSQAEKLVVNDIFTTVTVFWVWGVASISCDFWRDKESSDLHMPAYSCLDIQGACDLANPQLCGAFEILWVSGVKLHWVHVMYKIYVDVDFIWFAAIFTLLYIKYICLLLFHDVHCVAIMAGWSMAEHGSTCSK